MGPLSVKVTPRLREGSSISIVDLGRSSWLTGTEIEWRYGLSGVRNAATLEMDIRDDWASCDLGVVGDAARCESCDSLCCGDGFNLVRDPVPGSGEYASSLLRERPMVDDDDVIFPRTC